VKQKKLNLQKHVATALIAGLVFGFIMGHATAVMSTGRGEVISLQTTAEIPKIDALFPHLK
jgi:uncharacterized membrane protein (UPF0136 family)